MKKNKLSAYGKLSSFFYDATKKYSPEKEVNFYESFIKQNPGRVLEAMSGSGRLQIPLLQRGYIVDGVDNSKIMLERCRERCADLNLNPEIYEQSLENLKLPNKYNTVTIAVGSFQLITDHNIALQVLKNIRAHMNIDASLLIDIFVPDIDGDLDNSIRIANLDNNKDIRLTTKYVFDKQRKIADAYCLYELIVDGIVREQEEELISVTWYTDQELLILLKETGFDVQKIYEKDLRPSGLSRIIHAIAK